MTGLTLNAMIPATAEELATLRNIIYAIVNSYDGKTYVGKTTNTFNQRYRRAWWRSTTNIALRRTLKHAKPGDFSIYILEHSIPNDTLNDRERHYASLLNTYCPHGYNIRECGEGPDIYCPEAKAKKQENSIKQRKQYKIQHIKTGKVITIDYVKGWCKDHGVREMALRNLLCGIVQTSQGYCLPGAVITPRTPNGHAEGKGKRFTVKRMDTGELITFENAVRFARTQNLRLDAFKTMLNGRSRFSQGYCLPERDTSDLQQRIYEITDPKGTIYRFCSMMAFKREHGFDLRGMMYSGVKKNRKGWSNLSVCQEGTKAHDVRSNLGPTPNSWIHSPT